jgi:hypothetical protein
VLADFGFLAMLLHALMDAIIEGSFVVSLAVLYGHLGVSELEPARLRPTMSCSSSNGK